MKKITLLLACLCATSLSSCTQYKTTELNLSNYLDYFEVFDGLQVAFDSKSCTWEAPKDKGAASFKTMFEANFFVKSDKLENTYYNDVKFTYKINLYYGKSAISNTDTPDHVIDYTSHLHYYYSEDGEEIYVVGFTLWTYNMFYYDANNTKMKTYEISYLKSDYVNNDYQGTNYYRQIKLTSVSGTVNEGGLSGLNAHHCSN